MSAASTDAAHSPRTGARRLAACLTACIAALALGGPVVRGATLAELFAGGAIDAGAARFQSWQLVSLDSTMALLPDLSQILVTPLANPATNPGLQFAAAGQLATAGINALDIVFRFRTTTIGAANSFAGQSLGLTGVTLGGNSGVAYISQEITRPDGVDLGSAVVFSDNENDVVRLDDEGAFAPNAGPLVTVSIFLSGLASGDSVNLTSFTQRFAQTGPAVLPGDFNLDGAVDGSDFLVWQRGGSPNPVSAADLADWRASYGIDLGAAPALTATPEPMTITSAVMAAIAGSAIRTRPRMTFQATR